MHITKSGLRAMLYGSVWVKNGTEGNSHGFSRQAFVASLPVDSVLIPDKLKARLSAEEAEYVDKNLLVPARLVAEERRVQVEHMRRDPVRRLDKAASGCAKLSR